MPAPRCRVARRSIARWAYLRAGRSRLHPGSRTRARPGASASLRRCCTSSPTGSPTASSTRPCSCRPKRRSPGTRPHPPECRTSSRRLGRRSTVRQLSDAENDVTIAWEYFRSSKLAAWSLHRLRNDVGTYASRSRPAAVAASTPLADARRTVASAIVPPSMPTIALTSTTTVVTTDAQRLPRTVPPRIPRRCAAPKLAVIVPIRGTRHAMLL